MRSLILRRVLALLLGLGSLAPVAEAVAGPAADPHACRDHVCFCAPRAARPSPQACHGAAAGREEAMSGACRHRAPVAGFTLGMPFVPSEPALDRAPSGDGPVVPPADAAAGPGFTHLDTPPPRLG